MFKALEEVKEKDDHVNKNSHEAQQKALENINKRINNLVSLKISPDNSDGSLLSDEEFGDRKRNLLIENGTSEAKKIIFNTIGSYPKLKDKKLQYKAKYLFFKYKEGVKETNEKMSPLVPVNVVSDQSNLENYLKNSLWCTIWDDHVRRGRCSNLFDLNN
ncbi:MAG: hypothetical protein Q8P72_06800 [Candidatus Roizmanbacteria bacterium]|nr:hypothetical protein [Candidatus Roizmanbacteria bacterium]